MILFFPRHPAFDTPLTELKGVGPKTAAVFHEEGLHTSGELLALLPRFYQDRRYSKNISDLIEGEEALVAGIIISSRAGFSAKTRRRYIESQIEDENGDKLTALWFNSPGYMLKSMAKGRQVRLFGRISIGRRVEMIHPDIDFGPEEIEEVGSREPEQKIKPVYGPIGEVTSGVVRKLVEQLIPLLSNCPSLLPESWLKERKISDPVRALATLHNPPGEVSGPLPRPKESRAYRHLSLMELVSWRLMMFRAKARGAEKVERPGKGTGLATVKKFWETLAFDPSPEQQRVTDELLADLFGAYPMSRLLQGEVGGGKTAVAAALLFYTLGSGRQAAIMAPTEVLAAQHYDFLKKSADQLGFKTVLLTGSLKEGEKKKIREDLSSGDAHLAIGSQALLSPATIFKDLGLAVIDEQHRFGVRQRLNLRGKSPSVDILAMSATPIPRSLALMLYGDLDSSTLSGLLPGRTPAETGYFRPEERTAAYEKFMSLILAEKCQGFLVTPRIGQENKSAADGEEEQSRSLDDIYEDLKKVAPKDLRIDRLHGKMDQAEREKAMAAFREGHSRILVATSIIEVGVDVPAARVIMIEGAERFGLAQLHQLRGRVGRGGQPGWCLLLPEKLTSLAEKRLAALKKEHNGQILAELDLSLRGPGEQLGLRQSGWPAMRFASLPRDLDLLDRAQSLAEEIWQGKDNERQWRELWDKLNFEDIIQNNSFNETFD